MNTNSVITVLQAFSTIQRHLQGTFDPSTNDQLHSAWLCATEAEYSLIGYIQQQQTLIEDALIRDGIRLQSGAIDCDPQLIIKSLEGQTIDAKRLSSAHAFLCSQWLDLHNVLAQVRLAKQKFLECPETRRLWANGTRGNDTQADSRDLMV